MLLQYIINYFSCKILLIFSHVIFNNKYLSELIPTEASKSIIYHEFDNTFLKNKSYINDSIYFIGTLKKSSLNDKLIFCYFSFILI